ncbi:H-NS histone family protein [Achromobacter mucicolens]|uniref:H-NS histone family protein n=1 Tax=Achromobacter mucicolens TaxID=1389922 RepID=UPI0020A3D432|nr:H-NS histone family protein [Achromobacter mucicolens]MCP2518625.1 H-NS histone family protein [Achromobacter mucicolens]
MERALAKINAQIQTLQRRADTLRINHRASALQKILRQMHEFQISPEEIQTAYSQLRPARAKRHDVQRRPDFRSVVAPKYRNPESGETWSGRGRAPRWLTLAEKAGRDRDDFRV